MDGGEGLGDGLEADEPVLIAEVCHSCQKAVKDGFALRQPRAQS